MPLWGLLLIGGGAFGINAYLTGEAARKSGEAAAKSTPLGIVLLSGYAIYTGAKLIKK